MFHGTIVSDLLINLQVKMLSRLYIKIGSADSTGVLLEGSI